MDGFRAQWEPAYPKALAGPVEDFESITLHLRFPAEPSRRCRHTYVLDHTFGARRGGARRSSAGCRVKGPASPLPSLCSTAKAEAGPG